MSGSESLAPTAVAVTVTDGRPAGAASDVTVTKRDGVMALAWCIGGPHRGDGVGRAAALAMAERVPWAERPDRI
jgi:hypothetical protein